MKKSYHSKIVPTLEAAMTRRMSFALGSDIEIGGAMPAVAMPDCSPLFAAV